MFDEMKKTVLWHAKQAYKEKLFAGTSGNLSVYDREADVMAITPSSLHYGLMQEEDIVIMRLDGTIVEGESLKRYCELGTAEAQLMERAFSAPRR